MKVHYTESNPVKKEFNALCRKMDKVGYLQSADVISKKSEMMILRLKLERQQNQIDELTEQVKILLQLVKALNNKESENEV